MDEQRIREIIKEEMSGMLGYVFSKHIQILDGRNIIVGKGTGTKIGTEISQKIGFFNTLPVIQPTTAIDEAAFTANSGTAVNDNTTFDSYTLRQVVKALRNLGLLA